MLLLLPILLVLSWACVLSSFLLSGGHATTGPSHGTGSSSIVGSARIATLMSQQNSPYSISFGGVKFSDPIASALMRLDITSPSPIQKASIAPIMTGLNCIVHAETGSGKTLVYLLPLMKRLLASDDRSPLQALIVVPTIELARQVASDIQSLVDAGPTNDKEPGDRNSDLVCVLNHASAPLGAALHPIAVGTPRTLLKMSQTDPIAAGRALRRIRYLVLDEVDRLLETLGKYATNEERAQARINPNEASLFLELLADTRRKAGSLKTMQVVAGSATVGRPLRRELAGIFSEDPSASSGEFTALRAATVEEPATSGASMRAVTIPAALQHYIMLLQERSDNAASSSISKQPKEKPYKQRRIDPLKKAYTKPQAKPYTRAGDKGGSIVDDPEVPLSFKMTAVDKLWNGEFRSAKRGILFVPSKADMPQILGMLRFWMWKGVKTLADVQQQQQQQQAQEVQAHVEGEKNDGEGGDSGPDASSDRELFLLAADGARGIHIADVDCVMILAPPKTMDEYLHMAGRTGRMGNKRPDGAVVTVAEFDDLRRLQAWETPLSIQFKVKYQ